MKRPPTLLEAVVDEIREEIYRGTLLPGQPLRESRLSDLFDVSRITVREALRTLHEDGLVDLIPHRGAYVKKLTPELAKEIYTVRALLEPYAVGVALKNKAYCQEDYLELENLVLEMGEHELKDAHLEMIKADVSFHLLLCQRSGLELVTKILDGMQAMNVLFMLYTSLYDSDAASEELTHRIIIDVLRQGDAIEAEAFLRKHIENAGESLIARMEEMEWQKLTHGRLLSEARSKKI